MLSPRYQKEDASNNSCCFFFKFLGSQHFLEQKIGVIQSQNLRPEQRGEAPPTAVEEGLRDPRGSVQFFPFLSREAVLNSSIFEALTYISFTVLDNHCISREF